MYYCKSRFYVPKWRRWLNSDSINYLEPQNITCLNLFAYCNNNPVMYVDPTGDFAISILALLIGAGVGALIGAGSSVISQGITNGWSNINGWQVLLDGTIGAINGLLSTSGIGKVGAALLSGGLGFAGSVGGDLISNNGDWSTINWGKAAIMGGVNLVLGYAFGAGSRNTTELSKSLLKNGDVNKAFGVLYNATNNYLAGNISKRGFAGIFNLYGKQFINAVTKAMPGTIARLTAKSLKNLVISTVASTGISTGLYYLF